jgi:hypothetical protein
MKIFCVYFNGKYSPEYVGNLMRGLRRNSTVDFEFICYSDTLNVEADRVILLPKETDIKIHWHKLKFFDPTFAGQTPGEEIIVLDIDQVVVNDIDEMLRWPIKSDNTLISYNKWWNFEEKPDIRINGGWYKFRSGDLKYIYDKFMSNIEYWQLYYFNNDIVSIPYYGEQNFVQDTVIESGGILDLMPGQYVVKYQADDKYENLHRAVLYTSKFKAPFMMLGDEWYEEVKIVHFTSLLNNIHDCNEGWVKDHWR